MCRLTHLSVISSHKELEIHVVKRVVEILRLMISGIMILVERLLLRLVAALTFLVTATTAALISVATTTTVGTLRTRTALTLYISLWFRDQHAVTELVLTGLRINLKEFHGDLVTFLQTSLLNSLQTLPVDLADVQQTVLTRAGSLRSSHKA